MSLVTGDWLAAHLGAPELVVLEVDEQPLVYRRGHVPGAHALDWRVDLRDPVTRDLPDHAAMRALFARLGITPGAKVVLYGDKNNWHAAFAFWLLRFYGLEALALLDGGRQLWLAEGRPLTTELPAVASRPEVAEPQADPRLRAAWWDVLRDAGTLLDVRTPAEYAGRTATEAGYPEERAQRPGHIPGAVNVPWDAASGADGRFLPLGELRALYAAAGVEPARPVIAYCRIGERSAHTWFVLHELLGHRDVRNYDGSWTEWGSMVGMPVALGGAPGALDGEGARLPLPVGLGAR